MSICVTSYCNQGHRLTDGKPVGHSCYILPVKALELEQGQDVEGATAVLVHWSKGNRKEHRGVKP